MGLPDTSVTVAVHIFIIINTPSFTLQLELGFCPRGSCGLTMNLLITGHNTRPLVTNLKWGSSYIPKFLSLNGSTEWSNRKYDQTLLSLDPMCCQHHSCVRIYKCPEFHVSPMENSGDRKKSVRNKNTCEILQIKIPVDSYCGILTTYWSLTKNWNFRRFRYVFPNVFPLPRST